MSLSDPCRIVFIVPSLIRGGAEGQLCELIRRLDRAWFAPALVVFKEVEGSYPRAGLDCEVQVLCASKRTHRQSTSKAVQHGGIVWRLYSLMRAVGPDIVHALLPAATILGLPSAALAGVPVKIAGRRSLPFYRRGARAAGIADRCSLRFADAVIANCTPVARFCIQGDGFPASRVFTIPNGVDCERFKPGGDPQLRRRFGWSSEHVVFGMVANFYPYKRHVDFVLAAVQIHSEIPSARFLLVGRPEDAFAPAMRLRSELGLEDVVQVMPATSAPESVYAALDVCVSASETEGCSNVVLEAMACGRPVIATDVGGNPEIVKPGETGFLTRPFAPDEIAAAARTLAGNADLCRCFGQRARALVTHQFSFDKMVRTHESLYMSLLNRNTALISKPAAILETA